MLQEKDIIRFDYTTLEITDAGEIMLESTFEDHAKAGGIHEESQRYLPMTAVLGTGRLAQGLEEAILKSTIGEWTDVKLTPEEHFGQHKDNKVITYEVSHFVKKFNQEPQKGLIIRDQITEGTTEVGRVTGISKKRCLVDFNHPMAGKTLRFKFRVKEVADTDETRIKLMIDTYYRGQMENWRVLFPQPDTVELYVPGNLHFDENWQRLMKFRVIADIRAYLPQYTHITLIEEMSFEEDILRETDVQQTQPADNSDAEEAQGD